MVQSTCGGLLRYSVGPTCRWHSLRSEFRCAPVGIDSAFAVLQVRRMPSVLSGGGHSLKETPPAPALSFDADDDPQLAAAIAASLVTNSAPLSADAMRQARLARFG